jgi:redox-sensing transcriptional repressor
VLSPGRAAKRISESTVRRLSLYLRVLQEAAAVEVETISSEELARRGGTTSAQVRKDLSLFGSFGKRGLGYSVPELLGSIQEILGLNRGWRVALVGAGKIGAALFAYRDFQRRGFHIRAVFDSDPTKVGRSWGELVVAPDYEMERVLAAEQIDIVILAVPAEVAQTVAERVIGTGVHAILNFAPVKLRLPETAVLRNVDMALELEGLSYGLTNR